ncbi:MAG: ATP phosphoribosyltransferase regulatory subunit [Pseudomonadota bacterium]
MSTQDRWLLPDGIEEVLPDEARALEQLRRELLDLLATWGYELVMPPLAEYLESLLTGVGRELDLQTFKLTDQLSGRTMAVRADMTPQAARIDAHYLKRDSATRLCYLGPVLRTVPDTIGGTREPWQLGAELYGHAGPEADAEMLALMLAVLRQVGLRQLHVDLGHVGVYRSLVAEAALNDETEQALFAVLQRKASSQAAELLQQAGVKPAAREWLMSLLELNGGLEVLADARRRLKKAPAAVMSAIDNLEAIAGRLSTESGVPLHVDLAELSGYRYYTGAVFSVFVPGHGRAVCRGGRYDGIGKAFGRSRPATGFGADLRELSRLTSRSAPALTGILAPADGDAGLEREIARLRAAGERVVVRLPGDKSVPAAFGCDRALVSRSGRWLVEPAASA